MTKVPVLRIIPFSAVDGPGNRSAVFLAGCNQNCLYCHNPETINLCHHCGKCLSLCHTGALAMVQGKVVYQVESCVRCDACIHNCPHSADPRIRWMDAEDVMKELSSSIPYVRGVTVSGGECTLYPDFLVELVGLVHEKGKTLFVDTNGQLPLQQKVEMVEAVDAFMIDLKASSSEEALKTVGNPSVHVVENIQQMAEQGKLYEIRTVLCPSLMSIEKTVALGCSLIAPFPSVRYKLIQYRENGVRKENRWLRTPTVDEVKGAVAITKDYGIQDVIVI